MGIIKIVLEDEHGEPIEEVPGRTYLLGKFMPDDQHYQCLRFIDPYGDTVFNGLQMEQFIAEWDQIAIKAGTSEEIALMVGVKRLAEICRDAPHQYLKFYGD